MINGWILLLEHLEELNSNAESDEEYENRQEKLVNVCKLLYNIGKRWFILFRLNWRCYKNFRRNESETGMHNCFGFRRTV